MHSPCYAVRNPSKQAEKLKMFACGTLIAFTNRAHARDRRRKLAERPCLLGADFVGISSDYTTPLPGAIAPRLLVVRRKTGYLDLSPDSGDCVYDIFKFTRSPLGGGIYRTSAGRCRTTL